MSVSAQLHPGASSALYRGRLRHRRFSPVSHRLEYPVWYVFVDLDTLDSSVQEGWIFSSRRFAPIWLRRQDYLAGTQPHWAAGVREEASLLLARPFSGPVRLLTHPRSFGFRMNPVSFYFLYDQSNQPEALLAEVTNTPWDERHVYGADLRKVERRGDAYRIEFAKQFHVSPFQPMDVDYCWWVTPPDERVSIHMENQRNGERFFDATLTAERLPLSPASVRRMFWHQPFMTWKVFLWIYSNAARLWWKRVPFYPHPKTLQRPSTPPPPQGTG